MTLLQNLTLPAVVLLWGIVAVRIVGVARGGSRLLALILLLLVSMFTIKLSFVGPLIDEASGISGLQVYVRDCIGIAVAALSAHTVARLAREQPSPRWSTVGTVAVILAAYVSMMGFFLETGPDRQGVLEVGPASGELPALGFWLSYLLPYGAFLMAVVVFAFRDARRAGPWTRGRRGLVFFGIGAAAGDIYVVTKILVLTNADPASLILRYEAVIQGVPSLLAVGFIAAGAATWTDLHLRDRYLLARLRPAHRALTRDQRTPRVAHSSLNVPERLDRRVVEIGEAITRHHEDGNTMPHYLPDDVPATEATTLLRQLSAARRAETGYQRTRLARAITEVLAPPNLGVLILVALGLREGALGWALLGSLFVSLLPYLVVIIGVRRGVWRDRMLTTRRERIIPLISNVSFAVAGLVVLALSPAPRELPAFLGAAIATQAVLFLVTLVWKISFHSGVAAGMLVITGLEFGWGIALCLAPLVLVIAWSRVQLREHTVAQVVAGAPVGALLLGGSYAAILAAIA
ncbi:hypothetical protein [Isoptericola sp. NPDC056134]|uniref:hypothetical protein n=1 Tax=Isoptericola sp. NPDC056134 TaxID=3345723 RepID=UPI0035EA8EA1